MLAVILGTFSSGVVSFSIALWTFQANQRATERERIHSHLVTCKSALGWLATELHLDEARITANKKILTHWMNLGPQEVGVAPFAVLQATALEHTLSVMNPEDFRDSREYMSLAVLHDNLKDLNEELRDLRSMHMAFLASHLENDVLKSEVHNVELSNNLTLAEVRGIEEYFGK